MTDIEKLVERLGKASSAVYLATDKIVADDLSQMLREAAAALTALKAERDRMEKALDAAASELGLAAQKIMPLHTLLARGLIEAEKRARMAARLQP